jgi:hypothetical protein
MAPNAFALDSHPVFRLLPGFGTCARLAVELFLSLHGRVAHNPDMVKTHGKSQPGSIERRSGNDRRRLESAPPASWERRRAIEPRKPEVAELEMTTSQWDALNDDASLAESRRI